MIVYHYFKQSADLKLGYLGHISNLLGNKCLS